MSDSDFDLDVTCVDTLRDELFQSEFNRRYKIKSTAELLDVLRGINRELEQRSDDEWIAKHGVSEGALRKCRAFHFFLGLDKSWIYK